MPLLLWILLFSLVGGLLSVLAASLLLVVPERWRDLALPHLVSFATGALLGAAFLALLPHALEAPSVGDAHGPLMVVLAGILGFFILEKLVLWRHCHTGLCELDHPHDFHSHVVPGSLILVGDAIHNFVDGVLIAAAFLTDFHLGVVTSLAVAAHEIPQELGDFAILLHSGFSRRRALWLNALSSLTTVAGATLAYFSLAEAERVVPYVLAVAAASFIYIAVADLIPGLHRRTSGRAAAEQFILIGLGVAVIYLAHSTLH